MYPVGLQVGLGTMLASTQKMHTPGPRQETRNKLDLAIDGEGFFEVLLPDGTSAYTRDGAFKKDSENRIVTGDGYVLFPELTIPEEATDISITEDGTVFVVLEGDPKNIEEIGRIEIVRFINPAGLASIGRNLYKETPASGAPIPGFPGELGLGRISQGFLEMSNVDVVEEMVKMIIVQRAYELNSRSILTADSLLSSAVTLKR
jgi:flagellar basal-body rod protein FlgG